MGGHVRTPGEYLIYTCEDSLDKAGYVLTHSGVTTEGNVKKADAVGETPVGINVKSTEDPLKPGTYLADQKIAVAIDGVVRVLAEDVTFTIGGYVQASAAGRVTTLSVATLADLEKIVGIALEKKRDEKETIAVLLKIRG